MTMEAEFELICNDCCEAMVSGPREQAWAEIQHYAQQYEQDGPIEIYEVTRTLLGSESEAARRRRTANCGECKGSGWDDSLGHECDCLRDPMTETLPRVHGWLSFKPWKERE